MHRGGQLWVELRAEDEAGILVNCVYVVDLKLVECGRPGVGIKPAKWGAGFTITRLHP